ncbi:MAG: transcription antitermination factor NusB [Acidobacteriota bacterium]
MATNARAVAVEFLQRIATRGARLDQLASFAPFRALSPLDRRLATELSYGVLRNRGRLDFYIRCLAGRELPRIDTVVLWILRLGLYEIEFLRTPDHAAVHQAVDLARRFRKASAASFVNAILRGFCRQRPGLPPGDSPQALAVRYSHPEWLVSRYLDRFGLESAVNLLRRNNLSPLPLVWVNRFKTDIEAFRKLLVENGIEHEPFGGLPDSLIVRHPAFSEHAIYKSGYCFFMDAASQEIAQWPDLAAVTRIGDLCAAPGGKAFVLAWRSGGRASVHCADVSVLRLREMRKRAGLLDVTGLSYSIADLTQQAPFKPAFDLVLVDVPCTGLGTLRSNPDIRWKIQPSHLSRFHSRQLAILRNGFRVVAPGGRLVYSTCSTEPEENEGVVEEFLADEPGAVLLRPHYR